MALKALFGVFTIVLTLVGIAGIVLVGLIGLVWGPLCLAADSPGTQVVGCRVLVRDRKTGVALIICGVMVILLVVAIVLIERSDRQRALKAEAADTTNSLQHRLIRQTSIRTEMRGQALYMSYHSQLSSMA